MTTSTYSYSLYHIPKPKPPKSKPPKQKIGDLTLREVRKICRQHYPKCQHCPLFGCLCTILCDGEKITILPTVLPEEEYEEYLYTQQCDLPHEWMHLERKRNRIKK